ncbi:MAG: hypothetical protein LUH63_22655 [Parabacteroides sp.]|nr:hypothetical protein [Parabacteroides sp.]
MSPTTVTCTYYDIEPKDAQPTITASTSNQPTEVGDVNWYNSKVTLTAPRRLHHLSDGQHK